MSQAQKDYNSLMTAGEHIQENRQEQKQLQRVQEVEQVRNMWMRGYTVREMATVLNRTPTYIIQLVRKGREEMAEWHKDEMESLAAERIEAFRQIHRIANDLIPTLTSQSSQLLGIALRAEENIGKIQGVISDKVHHIAKVTHEVKLYDFTDKFPEITAQVTQLEDGHKTINVEPQYVDEYEGGI